MLGVVLQSVSRRQGMTSFGVAPRPIAAFADLPPASGQVSVGARFKLGEHATPRGLARSISGSFVATTGPGQRPSGAANRRPCPDSGAQALCFDDAIDPAGGRNLVPGLLRQNQTS